VHRDLKPENIFVTRNVQCGCRHSHESTHRGWRRHGYCQLYGETAASKFSISTSLSSRKNPASNNGAGSSVSVLAWVDRSRKEVGTVGQPGVMCNPSLSPDGTSAVVDVTDGKSNNADIWLYKTADGANTRFTFDPEEEVMAAWSSDGKISHTVRSSPTETGMVVKPANGLGQPRTIVDYPGTDDILPNSWTPDGKAILSTHLTAANSRLELITYDVAADGKRFLVNRYVKPAFITPLTIVLNATGESQ